MSLKIWSHDSNATEFRSGDSFQALIDDLTTGRFDPLKDHFLVLEVVKLERSKEQVTSKPGAMKTLLDALWFFTEAHGYELWHVSTNSNGLHVASKGRQFMRNNKLFMRNNKLV